MPATPIIIYIAVKKLKLPQQLSKFFSFSLVVCQKSRIFAQLKTTFLLTLIVNIIVYESKESLPLR
jgi:hypothetical protein